jgi:hypothetical protein
MLVCAGGVRADAAAEDILPRHLRAQLILPAPGQQHKGQHAQAAQHRDGAQKVLQRQKRTRTQQLLLLSHDFPSFWRTVMIDFHFFLISCADSNFNQRPN